MTKHLKNPDGPGLGRPRWWQWITILSLDAPAVALLWQGQFDRDAQVRPRAAPAFVLAASVWLSYVADRWIEAWRLSPESVRTHRHRFHRIRRWPLAAGWAAVLAADVAVAGSGLSPREWEGGLLLLGAVLVYLFSHQLLHRHHPLRVPKEICVGVLIAWGAAWAPAAAPGAALGALAGPGALFAALCFVNCALISIWEHAVDRSHGQTSFARQFRRAELFGRAAPWVLAAAAAVLCLQWDGPPRAAALCAAGSGLLLGAVDLAEGRLGRQLARVLADAALLTPLVPLVGWRMR